MTEGAQQDITGLADLIPMTLMDAVPFSRQIILLYGEPKIGKTTFASKFPHAVFFDAEGGTMGINVPTFENLLTHKNKDRVSNPIDAWEDVLEATEILARAKGKGLEGTIVVDTLQAAFDMCRAYVLKREGFEHETDGGYGKGWRAVKDEFAKWVAFLKSIGFGIVFVGHQTESEIEEPTRKYQKITPRLDKGPRDIVEPFANLILYAQNIHIGGKDCRVLHTKGDYKMTAGERGENPRLQAMLPFDYDAVNRNWNGEPISLNEWFGFAQPAPVAPPAPPAPAVNQGSGQAGQAAPQVNGSGVVDNLVNQFGAIEVPALTS